MQVQHDSVLFAYDFDRLTPDGLLYDYGPHGLHAAFPGAGNNPTRATDGSYYFDGSDYLLLTGASQARFYTKAPTGAFTFLVIVGSSLGATNRVIFSTFSPAGGNYWGILLRIQEVTGRLAIAQMKGTAVDHTLLGTRTNTGLRNVDVIVATCETTPRQLVNGAPDAAAWSAGAFGVAQYDTTVIPTIGVHPNGVGAAFFNGFLHYLALINGAVSQSDAAELSAMMMNARNGSLYKPFCWR